MLKAIVVVGRHFTSGPYRASRYLPASRAVWICFLGCLTASQMSGQAPEKFGMQSPQADGAKKVVLARDYGKLPLSFEANRGQTDPQVRFLSRGNGYSLFLTDSAAVLSLHKPDGPSPRSIAPGSAPKVKKSFKTDVVRMELSGASRNLHVTGDSQLPGTANYFIGNDPSKWHSAVPTYAQVKYEHVYPGVDLVYYGNQSQLEYDFVVAPNADPKPIKLHFAGASKLKLDAEGDLEIISKNGQIAFHKPVVYQTIAGQRKEVEGRFTLLAKNTVGFTLDTYDHGREVVIDPTLSYSTYLGGSTGSQATAIAVDSSGSVYVTGETVDADFPNTNGPFQDQNNAGVGVPNAFITKLNPAGSELVFSTYLGGSGNRHSYGLGDVGTAIAVDSSGNSYITGYANSSDFPLKNPYQGTNKAAANNLSEPFVTKVNALGTGLVYSTYLGGSSNVYGHLQGDQGLGITVDKSGSAYVTGTTYSTDFPFTNGAFQTVNTGAVNGTNIAFVSKFDPTGQSLVYSTYLGGSGGPTSSPCCTVTGDGGRGIAVDATGNVYVTGLAGSLDFPITPGALQTKNKGAASKASNAFVTKLNPTGSSLVYSTYLGGSSNTPNQNCFFCFAGDGGAAIAVDVSGDAFVAGGTYSSDFPVTTGAFQKTNKAYANDALNAFVSEIDPTGTTLIYSTLLGGSGSLGDVAYGVKLDPSGDIFVGGFTSSADFPISEDAFQTANHAAANKSTNAFLTEINPGSPTLVYSTYLGGSGYLVPFSSPTAYTGDIAYGIVLDCSGNAYMGGGASSPDFPFTASAYQTVAKSPTSAFVSKFSFSSTSTCSASTAPAGTTTTLTSDGNPQNSGTKVTFTAYVQPSSGTGIPTGTVTFTIDGTAGSPITLDSTGHAAYATSSLSAGLHTITAAYSGDTSYSASTSTQLAETIIGPAASIAVVSGSDQSALVGSPFAAPLLVVVEDAHGNRVNGVSVSFSGTGLSFASTATTTGADGTASTTATPNALGTLTATAATTGVSASAAFTLTGSTNTAPTGSGIITTYAGDGASGFSGDGAKAIDADLAVPVGLAMDSAGNLYVADQSNSRIRKITPTGIITTVAGNGTAGFSGDGGTATSAELNTPAGLAIDSSGNLYIGDENNHRIRKVTPAGIISTFAGTGTGAYNGDGIAATNAELYYPNGVAADSYGNIYIADYFNNRIRKVSMWGIISTVAGNGTAGFSGDGGAATSAEFNLPTDVAVDVSGNLYIADNNNARVRQVNSAGVISTIAGTGYGGYNGDGIAATSAELYAPDRVAVDPAGNVYISEFGNNRIRKIDTAAVISTIAGTGKAGYTGDGGPATSAEINIPRGLVIEGGGGSVFISDSSNNRVRQVQYETSEPVFSVGAGDYTAAQSVTIADTTSSAVIYYTTDGTTPTTNSTKYTGTISVSASETIEAIAIATGYSSSTVASASYIINIPQAAIPTFSPVAGTYTSAQSVTLADSTTGAVIYYTLDGSTPTAASTKYAAAISVGATETIEAIATATGDTSSSVTSATYTINIPVIVATPVFSPAGGFYTSVQTVTISDSTSGASIYYTLDGSTPTAASTKYAASISVGATETIKAIAIAAGDTNSATASAAYTINLPAAAFTVAATPASATVTAGQAATYTITVTPQNGFIQAVAFACPELAASLQCSFAPATVTPAGAAISSTLTVSTSTTSADVRPGGFGLWKAAGGAVTIALVLWPFRRRRLHIAGLLTILLIAGPALIGCGSKSTTSMPQPQTYTVTVTATGGGVSQSSPLTLTVTN